MSSLVLTQRYRRLLGYSLLFMLAARLVASAIVPLTDSSEARYGEIARKMLETGDWITPQHDYGVPFWAKPPLSTWLAAASMKAFGVNEFAARLPSLLLGLAMLALVGIWTARLRGRDFALATCVLLGSSVLFFIASGTVMTDASLACCTTLTMVAFWQALHAPQTQAEQKCWGYLFFVGLGAGLLAKGPIVGVLTLLPILPWIALQRRWRQAWRALPWIGGTALMLLIAAPWYWLAEHKTPGFLSYFILGEHFGRFLHSGWTGDKYGNAHAEPLGMIWAYWFAAAFPWSLVVIAGAVKSARAWREWLRDDDGLLAYLLLWSFAAIVFFTLSHNIIWTYPLPALPAFAVLAVELLSRFGATGRRRDDGHADPIGLRLLGASFATPVALLALTAVYADPHQALLKSSQRGTATWYLQARPSEASGLYYFRRRYYSGEFYSAGRARVFQLADVDPLLHNGVVDFLVMHGEDLHLMPATQRSRFEPARTFGAYVVLEEKSAASAAAAPTSPPQ